jgi:hypothetical protein
MKFRDLPIEMLCVITSFLKNSDYWMYSNGRTTSFSRSNNIDLFVLRELNKNFSNKISRYINNNFILQYHIDSPFLLFRNSITNLIIHDGDTINSLPFINAENVIHLEFSTKNAYRTLPDNVNVSHNDHQLRKLAEKCKNVTTFCIYFFTKKISEYFQYFPKLSHVIFRESDNFYNNQLPVTVKKVTVTFPHDSKCCTLKENVLTKSVNTLIVKICDDAHVLVTSNACEYIERLELHGRVDLSDEFIKNLKSLEVLVVRNHVLMRLREERSGIIINLVRAKMLVNASKIVDSNKNANSRSNKITTLHAKKKLKKIHTYFNSTVSKKAKEYLLENDIIVSYEADYINVVHEFYECDE